MYSISKNEGYGFSIQIPHFLSNKMSLGTNFLIICGHYKGIDERIRQHSVTLEISIGDYVLSGGELAAAVIVDFKTT